MTPPKKPDTPTTGKAPDDRNTAFKRAGRYARVSTRLGGFAARLAGDKMATALLGRDQKGSDAAASLRAALGNLRGPLMKIAQLLATIPDALPADYARELQQLQSNAPPMGWPFVRRRMAAELGADWEKHFSEFPRTATAAASLGQVHRAVTADGKRVACKVQYPDMASAVEADLNQLSLVLNIYESVDKAVQTQFVKTEIADRLREELDYAREAKQCALYGLMLQNEKNVHVPHVIPHLSSARLLTTTWLDGQPILNFKTAPLETRNDIAVNLFRAWYVPLYQYGVIHGDPHPGNYTVRSDNGLNLLDFGCIRVFPARFIGGILDLYRALQTNDRDLAAHAYEAWGFTHLSRDMLDTLNIWARFLYQAVLDDKTRVIGQSNGTVYGRETALSVYKALREHGGITIPREFVFMDRAALGLGSVFIHLQAEVNWHRIFNELIADFDADALTKRQNAALKKAGL